MRSLGATILVFSVGGLAVALLRGRAAEENATGEYVVTGDSSETPRGIIRALGYVEPLSEVRRLTFKRDGVIASCLVNLGDRVSAGAVLMTLASQEEAARLSVAERECELAQAERAQLRAGVNKHRILAAERNVEDSLEYQRHASRYLARIAALNDTKAVTDAERDRAAYDAAHGKAAFGQAQAELEALRHFVRDVDLATAEAKVSLAQARVAAAAAELEATILRAPFAGSVLEILRREGEAARASDGLAALVFADDSRLRVRAEIDDRCLHDVREGQRATIHGRALGDQRFVGDVTVIKRLMGNKTVFARTSRERKDLGVVEVLIDAPAAFTAPVGLQVDVAIERRSEKGGNRGAGSDLDTAAGARLQAGQATSSTNERSNNR